MDWLFAEAEIRNWQILALNFALIVIGVNMMLSK